LKGITQRKIVCKVNKEKTINTSLKKSSELKTLHSRVVITTNQQLTRPAQPEKKGREVPKGRCAMEEKKEEIQAKARSGIKQKIPRQKPHTPSHLSNGYRIAYIANK